MRRHKNTCMIFNVPSNLVSITEEEANNLPKKANDLVVKVLNHIGILRGDLVHFESIPSY
jgi:hypothetical protein